MNNSKKIIALTISLAVIFGITSCDREPDVTTSVASVTEAVTIPETTSATTEQTIETEPETGHYEFRPKVMSSIFRDIMGDGMCEAYYSYIDAVMNNEDSFAVNSVNDYDWMLGQFPGFFSPVVAQYAGSNYDGGYSDGRGTFHYVTTREVFELKESEFETLVTDILNEALRDDYSDFEKVLALYIYFSQNYTYDYDTLDRMDNEYVDNLSPYRFLTEKTGICSECAPAYSYLLLQAGVDATVAGGGEHCWSYVTINGRNYHVDPTFAMSSGVDLSYLMMTDERREIEGGFTRDDMCVGCHYKSDRNGEEYTAADDFFAPLWGCYLVSWDHADKVIVYEDTEAVRHTFDYSSFG